MNTVSWLIYLTYVVPTISGWFIVATWVSILVLIPTVISYFVAFEGDIDERNEGDIDERKFVHNICFKVTKVFAPLFVVGLLVSSALPNEKTMYMIAASELGEEVISSPEAKQLYQDLRDVLGSYKKEDIK